MGRRSAFVCQLRTASAVAAGAAAATAVGAAAAAAVESWAAAAASPGRRRAGSDLIGEANEELVVWETDAEGGKCGHMVPFENPKEFVACVVRNIAKAKTESV